MMKSLLFLLVCLSVAADDAKPVFSSGPVTVGPVAVKAGLKGAKELYLVVTDGGDGISADWSDWAEPVLIKADGSKQKLTELEPKIARAGWGKVYRDKNAAGRPMRMRDQPIAFGWGTHAPSVIAFDLPVGVVAFEAKVGRDNGGTDQTTTAQVEFLVFTTAPGEKLLASQAPSQSAADKPYGVKAAKESLKDMTVADGLAVSLFAAEPDCQNPTSIDIDSRGRVWVAEAVGYRGYKDLSPNGDRIMILEDTDGDGLADKAKLFYQGPDIVAPLGICVLGNQVIVSAAPNIWLLTDTDGDDKADKKELLLTGIKGEQNDHSVHTFSVGSGGKLCFNMGNAGGELHLPDGKPVVDLDGNEITTSGQPYRQGMALRCDLVDGRLCNFEVVGCNFRNPYEVAADSFGTHWQSDNDDDGNKGVRINYLMDFGNYGYVDEKTGAAWKTLRTNIEDDIPRRHWHQNDPGVVPNMLITGGGSPTGILVNESPLLGPVFFNQIIHSDAGPHVVRAYPAKNDGAGYKATMVNILSSTDAWCRPSDVCLGPDGSLFIADWYDSVVGGNGMDDHESGRVRGRIYRVAPKGCAYQVTPPDLRTAAGCAAALASPNKATQYLAWTKLRGMGRQAEPELLKLWKNPNPRLRARALQLLAHINGRETKYIEAALDDRAPDIRITGLRIARDLKLDVIPLVRQLVKDRSPQVRRECAIALRHNTSPDAAKLWAQLAAQHDGKDRWYLEALGIGADGQEDEFFAVWLARVGSKWNTPAGRDIVWRVRSKATLPLLAQAILDKNTATRDRLRFFREFDFIDAPEKEVALLKLASASPATDKTMILAESLMRLGPETLDHHPELKSALDQVVAGSRGTPAFVQLVQKFKVEGQNQPLLDFTLKNPTDDLAPTAMQLVFSNHGFELVKGSLNGPNAGKTVEALGSMNNPRAVNLLLGVVTDGKRAEPLRQQAVRALAASKNGGEELLKLAKVGTLAGELMPVAAQALKNARQAAIRDEAATVFASLTEAAQRELPPVAALLKRKGNAANGAKVFRRDTIGCIKCHKINDEGVDFGPALSEIGTKLGKDAIYQAVIDPSAAISAGFEPWQIEKKDGDEFYGLIVSETVTEIVLKDARAVPMHIKKADIEKRTQSKTSIMPTGFATQMPLQDFVDLVEYLATLKKK